MAEHSVNEMVSMHKNSFAVLSLLKQAILSISRGPRKPDTVHGYQIIFSETYQELNYNEYWLDFVSSRHYILLLPYPLNKAYNRALSFQLTRVIRRSMVVKVR